MNSSKLEALKHLYGVYDDFVSGLNLACGRTCSDCCTCNVTLTTLEGYYIIESLTSPQKQRLISRLAPATFPKRFIPQITTNQLAAYTLQNRELPAEENDPLAGDCTFLTDDECPIYPLRPFGCRCLISKSRCGETGYADMDEFVFTVNTVFLQSIEHLDSPGCYGNLSDLLFTLKNAGARRLYEAGRLDCEKKGLIPNHPMKALMVPPEHRERIAPILQRIRWE